MTTETPRPLSERVALVLDAAGHDPVTAVNFDQVTKAGYKVRVGRSGETYVYAELPPPDGADQAMLEAASNKSAGAWLGVAASVGHVRQMQVDDLLTAYATALRAEGFPAHLLDLGTARARLRVEPRPPCAVCGHIDMQHREGRCVTCGVLRMNDPRHAYAPKEQP